MKITKEWLREISQLVKELYETDLEYYHVLENKGYTATRKLRRSNSGFERKAENNEALKVARLGNRLLLHIRGLADSHGRVKTEAERGERWISQTRRFQSV